MSNEGMEEEEEMLNVFQLIDHQRRGTITEPALAQALLSTSLIDDATGEHARRRRRATGGR